MLANPSTAKQAGSLDPNRVRTGLTLTLSKCTSQSGVSERWLRFHRYLWLLYATDDVLPLDAWTFSSEAHPLPVASSAALLARQPPTDYLDLVTRSRLTPWTLAGVVVCVLVGVFIMGAVDAFHAAASIHGAMAAAQRLATRYWARLRG